jgi:vanillate O-demethylase ferredoxin subunit
MGMDRANADPAANNSSTPATITTRIAAITREAEDILSFDLVANGGGTLSPFTAGAHVDVHLGDGMIRQYSLCGDPAERDIYRLAVLDEARGRGGSKAMHALRAGERLVISAPRNNFPLAGHEAISHLLLAGGIGVTPMMAMIHELEARGADYLMHYCTRSPAKTAFRARLESRIKAGRVVLHHDGGDPTKGLDLARVLADYTPAKHVYICGPKGFIAAARAATEFWPPHCVHVEHFSAPEPSGEDGAWDAAPFQVKLLKSGQVIDVPANTSIVAALRAAGHDVATSCEEGICGTCITHYVEGEPVHRDTVLGDDDRKTNVMICRARSKTPMLVLDL